eukprot:TRINITY_DN8544_c0_g2_i6.p1 TRINITY_DN8544_c0_g2~~TRINITY_DN8544_c0_g2_i6.p1  ORF type:complete len:172 (+),score=48.24 TRINITY_DN8544_c0_g2_i6:847-1362(+)
MILELALDDQQVFDVAQGKRFSETQKQRVLRLRKTKTFQLQLMVRRLKEQKVVEGVSYSIIGLHMRQLKFKRSLVPSVFIRILDDIRNYMKDSEQVIEVLALLPKCREGLNLIATGLMSQSEELVKRTIMVLSRIKEVDAGKEAFSSLNPILLQVYYKKLALHFPDSILKY